MYSRAFKRQGQAQAPFRRQVRINDQQLWQPPDPGQPVVYAGCNGVWYRTYWPHGKAMPSNVVPRSSYDRLDRKWEELPWLPQRA